MCGNISMKESIPYPASLWLQGRRVGPQLLQQSGEQALHLGSTVQLALHVGVVDDLTLRERCRRASPASWLLCGGKEEIPPPLLSALNTRGENWPFSSPTAAFWRAGPASPLGSTVKLTLMARVLVGGAQGCEHGIIGLTTCLPRCGMGERTEPLPHPLSPTASRRAGPKIIRTEELALPLTCCSPGRKGPVPHLSSRVELVLRV